MRHNALRRGEGIRANAITPIGFASGPLDDAHGNQARANGTGVSTATYMPANLPGQEWTAATVPSLRSLAALARHRPVRADVDGGTWRRMVLKALA